ncbi:hypothetical protein EV122DRAFT_226302, partial [Schizophyllum commune]
PDPCDVPLCSCLDTKDLISYSQASRDTRRSAATYGRQAFQIRHSLVKFMAEDDVRSFREVMRRTGTVITGSVVVHFFARTSVGDADLDLVVEWSHSAELFAFIRTLGYAYAPRPTQENSTVSAVKYARLRYTFRDQYLSALPNTILDVLSFVRGSTVIRVIIPDFSAMDTILSFHSTPTMNAITFRAAYSLYPRNTFIRSVGVCFRHNNHVDTYKRRGWTMESSASGRLRRELGEEVNAPIRFVGNINTWTIDLDDRPSRFLDTFLFNSWELRWAGRCNWWIMPRIESASYIGNNWWPQNRTFADCDLLGAFMLELMRNQPRFIRQTDEDVLRSILLSARDMLFVFRPPCVTDTTFMPEWDPEDEPQDANTTSPQTGVAAEPAAEGPSLAAANTDSPRASKPGDDDVVHDALNALTIGDSSTSPPPTDGSSNSEASITNAEYIPEDGLAGADASSEAGGSLDGSIGAGSDEHSSTQQNRLLGLDGSFYSGAHTGDNAYDDADYVSDQDDILYDSDDTQSSWSVSSLSDDQPPLKRMRT